MTIESEFLEPIEQYFLDEALDLLETIEQTLLNLLEEKTTEKVHTLMRSAHTLKGSAASCELKTIETIAHHLEDVFQALYPNELDIDPELGSLLLEGYDCLKTPLNATLSDLPYDEEEILDRTAAVFAQLQTKLGDFFGREAPLPTAEELGFDVVGLIFADSVAQDLQQLETAIASEDLQQVQTVLRAKADFFQELGVSYDLPGLAEIAQATITAMEQSPDRVLPIAQAALDNFQQAVDAVLAGDRTQGGVLSDKLRHWTEVTRSIDLSTNVIPTPSKEQNLVTEEELTIIQASANPEFFSPSSTTEELLNMVDNFEAESPSLDEEELTIIQASSELEISSSNSTNEELLNMVDDFEAESPSLDEEELTIIQASADPEFFASSSTSEELLTMEEEEPTSILARPNIEDSPSNSTTENLFTTHASEVTSPLDRILQSIFGGDWETIVPNSPPTPLEKTNESQGSKTRSAEVLPTIRVTVRELDRLSHSLGELLISENQQHLQSERIHSLTQNTFEQFLQCQQKLSQIRDWSDRNLLLSERERRRQHQKSKNSQKSSIISSSLPSSKLIPISTTRLGKHRVPQHPSRSKITAHKSFSASPRKRVPSSIIFRQSR